MLCGNCSEFFWIKVKRFSEIYFTAKFWVFKLKMRFRMAGEDKIFQPPFFLLKKNGERSRTCHGVARRAKTEGFSSRGDSRSSLKTAGFLPCHGVMQWSRDIFTKFQKPCLWSRFIPLTLHFTCEVAHFIRLWSCRLTAGGCAVLYSAPCGA